MTEPTNKELAQVIQQALREQPQFAQTKRLAIGVFIGMMAWAVGVCVVSGVVAYTIVEKDVDFIPASLIGAGLCFVMAFLAYAFAPVDER
jgi:hypothetical protein